MSTLFGVLVFLSLAGLVVGLIKPSIFKLKSRKQSAWVFGGAMVVSFMLFGIATPTEEVAQVSPEPVVVQSFDVPSLIGKNIDEIETAIGKAERTFEPTTLQEANGPISSEKTFTKGETELMVSYNAKTRVVIDLFISSDDPSGASSDTAHLLQMGNLAQNATAYTVKFVPAIKDPSVYTGVVITQR
ncbi:MAG: hypothetical protein AAB618_00915 [Patescibacteria group bacterium]